MHVVTMPMHTRPGSPTRLIEILSLMPENAWEWSVVDYDGIGLAPNGLAMGEFVRAVREMSKGYLFDWQQLISFADDQDQTIDCLIVAASGITEQLVGRARKDDFRGCLATVEAFDSNEWTVTLSDQIADAESILERIRRIGC